MALSSTDGARALRHGVPGKSAYAETAPAGSDLKTCLTARYLFDSLKPVETSNALLALAALAQETRLAVYRLLVEHAPEGLPAGEIAQRLEIPAPSLSFHLKELWRAGLVAPRQDGRFVWYRADLTAMDALIAYLTENCCRAGAACDPSCVPARASKRIAAAMPVAKRRRSA